MARRRFLRRAAPPVAVLLAVLLLPGCTRAYPHRESFRVEQSNPASSELVISVFEDDCSTTHVKVKETAATVFVHVYLKRKQRAECPETGRTERRTVTLGDPLGQRAIVDGIPPDETRTPEPTCRPASGVTNFIC